MRTADLMSYAGPGRIVLSPVFPGVARGYRLAPKPLRARKPVMVPEVRARLAALDPAAMWVALHGLTYPHEPILCAAGHDIGWRDAVAGWLALWIGHAIPELDPANHRAQRAHPRTWRPLVKSLQVMLPRDQA